jgi:hypothetical protein
MAADRGAPNGTKRAFRPDGSPAITPSLAIAEEGSPSHYQDGGMIGRSDDNLGKLTHPDLKRGRTYEAGAR